MLSALILAATLGALWLLLRPALARAPLWRATVTPLASIIGSGFLVVGPILNNAFGFAAAGAMAVLCLIAWGFGAAIRYSIAHGTVAGGQLDRISDWVLAGAYVVSVAYYLSLFGAFAVRLTPVDGALAARWVTSAAFLVILGIGASRGFGALERLEQASVTVKLAVIAGLLAGLAVAGGAAALHGGLVLNPATQSGPEGLRLVFGLIVTVQGFEISRYLGAEYDGPTRIRSMRIAQGLSAAIYLGYVLLLSVLFEAGAAASSETAIIALMGLVAPVLPLMLVVAALSAQFSAAIADTGGSGGLVAELTGGRIGPRSAYGLLVAAGLALIWTSDVFQIISHASRAFALYYALQAGVAALTARARGEAGRAAGFGGLAALGLMIAVLGLPVE